MTTGQTDGPPPASDAADAEELTPEAAQAELEDLQRKYMRAVADYQNLRRRTEEDRKEYSRYTLTAVILNYLPVLDDLDRALESADEDIKGHRWVDGIRMVERKFRGVLEASGVAEIEATGQPFDPALHEAISYAPGPEGQVVAVAQAGYTVDGRCIRPAKVVVGRGEPPASIDTQA